MPLKTIPIFFTFNNDYVVPAAVAFYSLLNKAKEEIFYEMYVLHSDITSENQTLLHSIIGRLKKGKLFFIDTKNFLKDEWEKGNFDENNQQTKFTSDTLVRCFAARFFPQYDKIIYSDVDVVFADDVSELWDIDLKGKYLATVKNPWMKYFENELSHLKPEHYEKLKDHYFAGGIWVMNLIQIRADNLEQKMWDVIRDETIIKRWNDQDIMNIACDNKVAYIPLNYIAYPYMIQFLEAPSFQSHYTRDELWDSIINPKIVHYADIKPWKNRVRYGELWWDIFKFLNLPTTSIFEEVKEINPYKKKYKKYKKLSFILMAVVIVLLLALIGGFLNG